MWVRNAWYVAGWLPEFAAGPIHARTIIDRPIALYRTADGGLIALEDRCCHRFAPLSWAGWRATTCAACIMG